MKMFHVSDCKIAAKTYEWECEALKKLSHMNIISWQEMKLIDVKSPDGEKK